MKILKLFSGSQRLRDYVRKNILIEQASCDCVGDVKNQSVSTDECECKMELSIFKTPHAFDTTIDQAVPIKVSVVGDTWERLARTSPLR